MSTRLHRAERRVLRLAELLLWEPLLQTGHVTVKGMDVKYLGVRSEAMGRLLDAASALAKERYRAARRVRLRARRAAGGAP